jgi:hypothetical protein
VRQKAANNRNRKLAAFLLAPLGVEIKIPILQKMKIRGIIKI